MKKIFTLAFTISITLAVAAQISPRVFLNPGHGGHDSNDRPGMFFNYGIGDTAEYYESNSNLTKGLAMRDLLERRGYEVEMSRTGNTTADDLDLFEIAALANHSGADLFLAIHSNATGVPRRVNFPLALYRGWTGQPAVEGSDSIARCMIAALETNIVTTWSHPPRIFGDWTFYPDWGYKTGLGVLRYNKIPGMLTEGEFHDYLPEKCRLINADYCWLEGWNMCLAIDNYFGRTPRRSTGVIAGRVINLGAESHYSNAILYGVDYALPLNGVTVVLEDANNRVVATTTTDRLDNGVYVFRDIAPGRYRVRVANLTRDVTLLPATTAYCNLSFKNGQEQ